MKLLIIVLFASATQALLLFGKKKDKNEENTCGKSVTSCQSSPYRSYDGSCNNLANPKWGTPLSAYARITKNSYSNGVHEFPKDGIWQPLMNPREVSLRSSPDVIVKDKIYTVALMVWGQVVAHDMSFTALSQKNLSCCTNGQPLPSKMDDSCAPVIFPENDAYNHPEGNTCFDFVRTVTNKDMNCSVPGKVEEPLSSVTSYLDGSVQYGNSEEESKSFRTFEHGTLMSVERHGEQWLMQNPNPSACAVRSEGEPCYVIGDGRVNQHPLLALFQTILMREHNRIAVKLSEINPHWDDERCFQETRKIVIAKEQHFTLHEYLPIFLGLKNMIKNGLIDPNATGFRNDYDPSVNAQILTEHATAAFRAIHSTIIGQPEIHSESRELIGIFRLSDYINRPSLIEVNPAGMARGICTQNQNENDRFYTSEVTQFFARGNKTLGEDLRATDMQRSRDFGVGTYFDVLSKCGLGNPKSFNDLENYMEPEYMELVKKMYNKPEAIELAVGGLLERKADGTLSGPTFLCIMMEQFRRTFLGDRFFYEFENSGFTIKQLNSLRKSTLSRMICDNVKGVESMQPMAFKIISETNALVPCSSLPQEDLLLWKENTGTDNNTSTACNIDNPSSMENSCKF